MSSGKSKLTPVEWEIMEAVWRIGDSPSVRDVVDNEYANGEKAYTTIQTIMNTLEKKGLLIRKKIGLVNFYTPVKSRDQMVKTEMSQMIARIFNGSVPAMAHSLFDFEDLTLQELSAIKSMLNEKEKELKGESND